MKPFYLVVLIVFCSSLSTLATGIADEKTNTNSSDSIKIDHIEISGNWMTWDRIIKKELLFGENEWVSFGAIDTSIIKVWNIGNFADVKHEITESSTGNTIHIKAMDAVQFYPVLTVDHSSENDYNYRLGFGDENFLGSNCLLKIVWDKKPTGVAWDFSIRVPRQLLYKNMSAKVGYNIGTGTYRFLERNIFEIDGKKDATYTALMLAPFDKLEVYAEIGNPWHLDYNYRFSPNLSLRYMRHQINYALLSDEELALGVQVPENSYQYLNIKLSENIGTINKKRHRKNGYSASVAYNYALGLGETKSYHTFTIDAQYHKTVNKLVQFSLETSAGYTTATDQYQFIKGSSNVIGIRTGEIYGQSYYTAYAGSHFTWVNTKWVSLENAYFVNWGNGAANVSSLLTSKPKLAVGTSFEVRMPVVSFIAFKLTFMYAGPGGEWFKFNM